MVVTVILGTLVLIGALTIFYLIYLLAVYIVNCRWEKEEQEKCKQQDPFAQFEKIEWEDPQIGSQVDIEAFTTFCEYGIKLDRQKLYEMYKSREEKKKNEQESTEIH